MSAQELIDRLNLVTDKSLPVSFPRWAGERENGDTLDVECVTECQDCIVLDC